MKKVLLVLGLGLAMMSCSKEEIPVVEVEQEVEVVPETCEGGFKIWGFGKTLDENGYDVFTLGILSETGSTALKDLIWKRVGELRYNVAWLENLENGIACWYEIEWDDSTPPVITLIGEDLVTIRINTVYVDEGATAFDNIDGDITPYIRTDFSVNTSILGTYYVIYDVRDNRGNWSEAVTRTVSVIK